MDSAGLNLALDYLPGSVTYAPHGDTFQAQSVTLALQDNRGAEKARQELSV